VRAKAEVEALTQLMELVLVIAIASVPLGQSLKPETFIEGTPVSRGVSLRLLSLTTRNPSRPSAVKSKFVFARGLKLSSLDCV
jgi:hypothetical protein